MANRASADRARLASGHRCLTRIARSVSSGMLPPARTTPRERISRGLSSSEPPSAEAADLAQNLRAHGHVGADRVADRRQLLGQAGVAAAEHPVELGRKPVRRFRSASAGSARRPPRLSGIAEARSGAARAIGLGAGVVVDEGDDRTRRRFDPGVAGPRETARTAFSITVIPGKVAAAASRRDGLWSTTTITSFGGSFWRSSEPRHSTRSPQRCDRRSRRRRT